MASSHGSLHRWEYQERKLFLWPIFLITFGKFSRSNILWPIFLIAFDKFSWWFILVDKDGTWGVCVWLSFVLGLYFVVWLEPVVVMMVNWHGVPGGAPL